MDQSRQMILRASATSVRAPEQIDYADPPETLSPVAADLWRDLMPELAKTGMLTTHDMIGFAQLCEAYADWCEAREALAKNGGNYYLVGAKYDVEGQMLAGSWKLHPAYYAVSDSDRRLRGWCQEFALSPAVRLKFLAKLPSRSPEEGRIEDEVVDLSALSPDEREALRTLAEKRAVEAQEAKEDA